MLEARGIDLHYGQSQILFDVSLTAEVGQITAVMGNNGVGKTSLLKSIAGRHPASAGAIEVEGKTTKLTSAYHAARAGIAYVPQGREVFPMMTVWENLETGFACLPKAEHVIPDEVFDLFPVLRDKQGAGAICRAASNNNSPLRGRSSCGRKCCCWTSRPRAFNPP
jgi:urea transport system ATP-binding protein